MAETHGYILHVENYQWWTIHLLNRRLVTLRLNIEDILLDQIIRERIRNKGWLLSHHCLVDDGNYSRRLMHLLRWLLIASAPILSIIIFASLWSTTICILRLLIYCWLQHRSFLTCSTLWWALLCVNIATNFPIASRVIPSTTDRGTLRAISRMPFWLDLQRQLSGWPIWVLCMHCYLGLCLQLLWGWGFSTGGLGMVNYLLTHVICRIDSDQIGQFGLSLICLNMIHLCRGCNQSSHVDRLNLRPLISLESHMLRPKKSYVNVAQVEALLCSRTILNFSAGCKQW